MRGKSILGAAAAGATALAVFGLAGPAQAADASVRTTESSGGRMSYDDESTRDLFGVHDMTASDSYGNRGELRSAGGALLAWDYENKGGFSTFFEYDLAKGKQYVLRVCIAKGALGPQTNCATTVISDS